MATVRYDNATCSYPGHPVPAVDNLDIEIGDGEFMVLVGPSGSGKSTALRMLAGLEDLESGSIWIGDADVSRRPAKDRDVAMVFQNYALYPHMTVAENMGFALKLRRVPKSERNDKIVDVARILDLEPYLDRKPSSLSGGQRQRVAMGRAMVRQPSVFLMDEPLSNLDAKLRVETRANIAALQTRLGITTVFVTHDQVEAMTMGHRVAVLKDGQLQQIGTPRELFDRPCNAFVAGFIGSPAMNLRTVSITPAGALLGGIEIPMTREVLDAAAASELTDVVVGVRPEALSRTDSAHSLAVSVTLVEELGADSYVYGTLAGDRPGAERPYVFRVDNSDRPRIGDEIHLRLRHDDVHVFDPHTGKRLE